MRLNHFVWEPCAIEQYNETGWSVSGGAIVVGPDGRDLRVQYYSEALQCTVLRSLDESERAELPCRVDVVGHRTLAHDRVTTKNAQNQRERAPRMPLSPGQVRFPAPVYIRLWIRLTGNRKS